MNTQATDAPPTEGTHSGAGTLTWLRAVIVLAVALPIIAFAGLAWYTHRQTIVAAELKIDRSARVADEHAQKVFETNVAMIARILDLLGDDDAAMLPTREEELHNALGRMATDMSQLQGIFLNDENGRLIASNRMFPVPGNVGISDRAYFQQHQKQPDARPLVSPVLTSRSTGESFFNMSVRRSHRNGDFGGVISTSMSPSYFHNFYRELAGDSPDLHLELIRDDGTVLAAWPVAPTEGFPTSSFDIERPKESSRGISRVKTSDGHRALMALHDVGNYGIQVRVWMDDAAVLAPWYRELALLGSLLLIAAAGMVAIAWVALQKTRAALQAAEDLREETTRRRRVEDVLWQTQKLEAMGRLTGGVAHDFNNLLMIVSNSLFLQRRANSTSEAGPYIAAIERAVASGANLTRQLLSFSRRQPLRPEALRLQDRLPTIVDLLRTAIGNTVTIALDVDPETRPVLVDAAEFELALLNLAINAKDAMNAGGALRIRAENQVPGPGPDPTQDFVIIEVVDNGGGIPPALLERVFEPFFTTKPAGHGTGLGLSQVYGFCVRAGGMATAASTVGVGTTITLRLPATATTPGGEAATHPVSTSHMGDLRILLVEDNDDVADATASVLRAMGSRVQRCRTASEALDLLATDVRAFDLVVSDIVMPGPMDGIALARRMRTLRPAVPVLLMSGYSASLADAEAGRFDVLAKPCEPAVLARAIHDAMARDRADTLN